MLTYGSVCSDIEAASVAWESLGWKSTWFAQISLGVRRLTPLECERLQGFPDNHTKVSWRTKNPDACPDILRYKALGNSMAVPIMRWLGKRINVAKTVTLRKNTDL